MQNPGGLYVPYPNNPFGFNVFVNQFGGLAEPAGALVPVDNLGAIDDIDNGGLRAMDIDPEDMPMPRFEGLYAIALRAVKRLKRYNKSSRHYYIYYPRFKKIY